MQKGLIDNQISIFELECKYPNQKMIEKITLWSCMISDLGNRYYYDSEFEDEILKHKWKENKKGYLKTSIDYMNIGLHKFVYQIANKIKLKGCLYEVHHKDGNRRNNKLCNLELLNNSDHAKTKHSVGKSSKYYYVYEYNPIYNQVKVDKKWKASVGWKCKDSHKAIIKHLGSFKDELEAAKAADKFIENNQHLFLTRKKTNKEHGLY